MSKAIDFFERKGKLKCKEDLHNRVWYEDFLEFIKQNSIFADLLTPRAYGGEHPEARWDTSRICDFSEILGFYGLTYWYTWQVTILGLGPIWMSANEKWTPTPVWQPCACSHAGPRTTCVRHPGKIGVTCCTTPWSK